MDKTNLSSWYVYIIRTKRNTLYTGITTDVKRRFAEHQSGGSKCAKYLRGKGPLKLVYKKNVGTHEDALSEEFRIKKLAKAKKENLLKDC